MCTQVQTVHTEAMHRHGLKHVAVGLLGAALVQVVEAACGVGHHMQGASLEQVARGVDCQSIRQPLGVVAGICPFNFPAMVCSHDPSHACACFMCYALLDIRYCSSQCSWVVLACSQLLL